MAILQRQVEEFHDTFGIKVEQVPTLPDKDTEDLRIRLIEEEFQELKDALAAKDLVAVADALGDLLYVTYGSAVSFGIDMSPITNEIHRSNMTKKGGIKDNGGKLIKPATYDPPDLAPLLRCQGWQREGD